MKLFGRALSHIESDPNNTCVAHSPSSSGIRPGKLRRKIWIYGAHGPNKRMLVRIYGKGTSDVYMDVAQDRVGLGDSMGGQQYRSQKCAAVECVFRTPPLSPGISGANSRFHKILHMYTVTNFVVWVEFDCAFEEYDVRNFPYDIDVLVFSLYFQHVHIQRICNFIIYYNISTCMKLYSTYLNVMCMGIYVTYNAHKRNWFVPRVCEMCTKGVYCAPSCFSVS